MDVLEWRLRQANTVDGANQLERIEFIKGHWNEGETSFQSVAAVESCSAARSRPIRYNKFNFRFVVLYYFECA